MGRIHGRRGRIYVAVAAGAEASPLPFIANWSMSNVTDRSEVTAMEDDNKTYVAGLPDASGEFSGFYDDSTAQTYTAATDGVARKFYLYPNRLAPTTYWFGTILPDFSVNAGTDGPAAITSTWAAASSILKVAP